MFPWERPNAADIDITFLNVDTTYQSVVPRNPKLIKEIAKTFDIALFGRLRVARRMWLPNRPLFVFDGRHRFEGAKLAVGQRFLPCDVYDVVSIEREIDLFVKSNTRSRKVPQSMLFMAEVAAHDTDAIELSRLVTTAGLTIVDSNSAKQAFPTPKLTCIAALKSLYGHGSKSYARRAAPVEPGQLSDALGIIAHLAPPDALVTEHMVLGMVWLVLNHPDVRSQMERLDKLGWPRLDMAARAVGPRPVSREAGEALLNVIDWKRPKTQRLAPNFKLTPPPEWLPAAAA